MLILARLVSTLLLLILGLAPAAAAKDLALVSYKGNEVQTVTMAELVKICKGQVNHWPDGKPVTFVMTDPGSPEMKIVLQKIYDSSAEQVKSLIASANHGRTNHPAVIVVNSDEALVQKVASTPGAIGLVDVYSITGAVAVLKVAAKLPLEPGYPLHGN